MAKEQDSFRDLVAKAPLAPSEAPMSLVGTLARSKDEGKCVLILSDGRSVTLNTADVKSHTVLGNSLGLNVVQVEVAADVVRDLNFSAVRPGAEKIPGSDPYKFPILDIQTGLRDLKYLWKDVQHDAAKSPIEHIAWGSNLGDPFQATGIAPFGLATAPQAPAQVLALQQAAIPKSPWDPIPSTLFHWDHPHLPKVKYDPI
jgi:hypothetical protein